MGRNNSWPSSSISFSSLIGMLKVESSSFVKVASVWSQKTRIAFFERVVGILKTSLQNVRSSDFIFFILLCQRIGCQEPTSCISFVLNFALLQNFDLRLSLGGLAMFVAMQDTGEKKFNTFPPQDTPARSYSPGPVSSCQNSS